MYFCCLPFEVAKDKHRIVTPTFGHFNSWLVVWLPFFIFPYTGNFIIPIDELIFFRGVAKNHQPDRVNGANFCFFFFLSQKIFRTIFATSISVARTWRSERKSVTRTCREPFLLRWWLGVNPRVVHVHFRFWLILKHFMNGYFNVIFDVFFFGM